MLKARDRVHCLDTYRLVRFLKDENVVSSKYTTTNIWVHFETPLKLLSSHKQSNMALSLFAFCVFVQLLHAVSNS